jgi:hypothetical protein
MAARVTIPGGDRFLGQNATISSRDRKRHQQLHRFRAAAYRTLGAGAKRVAKCSFPALGSKRTKHRAIRLGTFPQYSC